MGRPAGVHQTHQFASFLSANFFFWFIYWYNKFDWTSEIKLSFLFFFNQLKIDWLAALISLILWVMAGARPSAASELHSILSFKRIPFHLSWLHYWIAPAKKSSWMRWDWRKEVNWRGIEWDEVKRLTGVKIYNPLRRLINEWNSLNGGGSQQINFTSPFNSSNQK